jgi:ATP dependent DNA ligase domain
LGRGDYVQFRERGLYFGVANGALPGQKRAHGSELKMKRHHVCRERADGANQVGDDFTLIRAECHELPLSNRGATDPGDPSVRPHDPHAGSPSPFRRSGRINEEKVDGWGIVAYKNSDRVRLLSRHGVDHTKRFAGTAAAIGKLSARTLVLDSEVAIYDEQLRSPFDWLRDPDPGAVSSPPVYMAFDMLYRDGRDLSARPLRDRRARLGRRSSPAASWCSRSGASRPMGCWRGCRLSSPATRATWPRTTRARTRADGRGGGSRSRCRGTGCRGWWAAGEDGTGARTGVVRCFRTMRLTNNQEAVCGSTACADLR